MLYPTNKRISKTKKMVLMGLFISAALVLSYFERFIPLNFTMPGIKLGLANVVTVVALSLFSPKEVLLIVFVRILMMGLMIGNVTSFMYSLAGGTLSYAGMVLIRYVLKDQISIIGVSVFGAFMHNLGQVLMLGLIISSLSVALRYFPILVVSGLVTGVLVGMTGMMALKYIRHFRLYES